MNTSKTEKTAPLIFYNNLVQNVNQFDIKKEFVC